MGGRVVLIGSCVTRDIWQFAASEPRDMLFLARTSLVSLMSGAPRTSPLFSGLNFDSEFQRRCVIADVSKSTLRDIELFKPSFLLLDFMDERFDLLDVDGAIVSLSHDFQACGLAATPWARAGRRVPRDSPEAMEQWTAAVRRFIGWVRRLGDVVTVLHSAPWVTRAVQGEDIDATPVVPLDTVCQICADRVVDVVRYGALAEDYNRLFGALMPEAAIVRADPGNQIGALGHVWGPSPFHYARSYYGDVGAKLKALGIRV